MSGIIPPYLTLRARVAVRFAREISAAEIRRDDVLVKLLELLRDDVLAYISASEPGHENRDTPE